MRRILGWGKMELASEIDGLDWIVVGIFAIGFAVSLYLVASVQGDLLVDDTRRGANDNEEAVSMFLDLVKAARESIIIHDDGNDSSESVYNNSKVIGALRDSIELYGVKVKCLFNDDNQQLELLNLARDFPNNVKIWYLDGDRPLRDIHYKIIDHGKLVHLSEHDYGSDERDYVLRKANKWWVGKGTRSRISKAYRENFDQGVKVGRPARIAA